MGFLAVGFLGSFAGALKADDLAYMLAGTGGATNPFGTVDLNTGAFTFIGNLGSGTLAGLGVSNGTLFTEQNGVLYSVNTANASLVAVGGCLGGCSAIISSFGSTTTGLYGLAAVGSNAQATLFSINPLTGTATSIGAVNAIPGGGGAYLKLSTNSGTLYMENFSSLYTVNTTTGVATLVGTDSNSIFDQTLLFENGTLYGGDNAYGIHGPTVDNINPATGQITVGAAISGAASSFGALAPDPLSVPSGPSAAPEPATLALLGAGLGAVGLFRRLRKLEA